MHFFLQRFIRPVGEEASEGRVTCLGGFEFVSHCGGEHGGEIDLGRKELVEMEGVGFGIVRRIHVVLVVEGSQGVVQVLPEFLFCPQVIGREVEKPLFGNPVEQVN